MTADEAVVAVLGALHAASIPYMIVGSLASNFHGVPRSTRDVDFVIELGAGALDRLAAALPPPLSLARQGAFETVTATTRTIRNAFDGVSTSTSSDGPRLSPPPKT